MSSFPKHVDNIEALAAMGYDVSHLFDENGVIFESWSYDNLVDLMSEVIGALQARGFSFNQDSGPRVDRF